MSPTFHATDSGSRLARGHRLLFKRLLWGYWTQVLPSTGHSAWKVLKPRILRSVILVNPILFFKKKLFYSLGIEHLPLSQVVPLSQTCKAPELVHVSPAATKQHSWSLVLLVPWSVNHLFSFNKGINHCIYSIYVNHKLFEGERAWFWQRGGLSV